MCPTCKFLCERLEVCERTFEADIWEHLGDYQKLTTVENNKTFTNLLDEHVRKFHPDSSTDIVIMTGKAN